MAKFLIARILMVGVNFELTPSIYRVKDFLTNHHPGVFAVTEFDIGVVLNEHKEYEVFLGPTDWQLQNAHTIDAFAAAEELSIRMQQVLNSHVGRSEAFMALVEVMEKYPQCGGRGPGPRSVALRIIDKRFGVC